MPPDPLAALRASLAEQLAALRGVAAEELPAPLLDVVVRDHGGIYLIQPADWEALRHEEGGAGRGVPYWARPWPAGLALAAMEPPRGRVLELGCGLGAPSIAAAKAGAEVLATDGSSDAVAFTAHALALNEAVATVAVADWADHGATLVDGGPWDVVLAADVFYTAANVQTALRLLPRLLEPGGELRIADPGRAGARDFLAAARHTFTLDSIPGEDVTLHTLRRR
ncbi:class I SAM-dependent methyltransferase [Candidatus Solirubrobacter pratensis]|uniref:class I SAM-dependent methyltransferase n=1 Tax=Candidatus Solirubrobacter pratensis TaxID=1298857 RepID=UPI000419598A|nr:methyltransferase [Candidatus Solirubrobacter pratensis]